MIQTARSRAMRCAVGPSYNFTQTAGVQLEPAREWTNDTASDALVLAYQVQLGDAG